MTKTRTTWLLVIAACWAAGAYFLWVRGRGESGSERPEAQRAEPPPRAVEQEGAPRASGRVEPGPEECLLAGTVVAGEVPVAGAVIRAVLAEGDHVALGNAMELGRCAADVAGRFELVMAAQDCVLVGEAEGLMSKHGVYVFAGPGERVTDVTVPLSAVYQVDGTVHTAAGAPVAGRTVELARPDYPSRHAVRAAGETVLVPVFAGEQVTDAEGTFRFRLPEGEWTLRVRDGGSQTWMGTVGVPAEGPLDIVDPEYERRDAGVVQVDGVVRDEAGAPVAGAEIRKMFFPGVERTDEEGRFSFSVTVSFHSRLEGLLISAKGYANTVVRRDVRGGAVERLDIVLAKGYRIAGRVTDPLHGKVSGRLVEISLESQGGDAADVWQVLRLFGCDSRNTDREGAFAVDGLVEGSYRLQVRGPSAEESATFRVEAGSKDVRLVIGETGGPEVVLLGRVLDGQTGTPMEGAVVSAWDQSRGGAGWDGRATTGPDGRFRISVLEEGNYRVWARRSGCVDVVVASGPLAAGDHEFEVTLYPERTLRVRVLDALGRPAAGAAIWPLGEGNARVDSLRDSEWPVITNESGIAELKELPARPLTLAVAPTHWQAADLVEVDLTAPERRELDVDLSTVSGGPYGRAVRVLLLTEDGGWAGVEQGCTVSVFDLGDRPLGMVTAEWRDGSVHITVKGRGEFSSPTPMLLVPVPVSRPCRLRVDAPGHARAAAEVRPEFLDQVLVILRPEGPSGK